MIGLTIGQVFCLVVAMMIISVPMSAVIWILWCAGARWLEKRDWKKLR